MVEGKETAAGCLEKELTSPGNRGDTKLLGLLGGVIANSGSKQSLEKMRGF